jgi:hypothetical protein
VGCQNLALVVNKASCTVHITSSGSYMIAASYTTMPTSAVATRLYPKSFERSPLSQVRIRRTLSRDTFSAFSVQRSGCRYGFAESYVRLHGRLIGKFLVGVSRSYVSAATNKGPLTGVPATSKGPPAGWFRHE